MEKIGVILAIDYGQKRLGLALSDARGVTSCPLVTWTRTNRRRDLARLRELARKHSVRRIVVGLPLHLDGTPSEMSEETKAFAARVQKALGIPVDMMDERLSSWLAEQTIAANTPAARQLAAPARPCLAGRRATGGRQGGRGRAPSRHRGRTYLDHIAAAVILRDYLERARLQTGAKD